MAPTASHPWNSGDFTLYLDFKDLDNLEAKLAGFEQETIKKQQETCGHSCYNLYVVGHEINVADLSLKLAVELKLPELERHAVWLASRYHDIDKRWPEWMFLKRQEEMSSEEMKNFQQSKLIHPDGSSKIIFRTASDLNILRNRVVCNIIDGVESHHEKYDSLTHAYPQKLKDGQIPFYARILGNSDPYDAMTNPRPYRDKMFSPEGAIKEMRRLSGIEFDPEMLEVFAKMILRDCKTN